MFEEEIYRRNVGLVGVLFSCELEGRRQEQFQVGSHQIGFRGLGHYQYPLKANFWGGPIP